jgi:hypothetical protein
MECKECIATNIWTTIGETHGSTPPIGLHEAIFDRVRHLKISVDILCKALERSEQGEAASETFPIATRQSVASGGEFLKQPLFFGLVVLIWLLGIRRRIPRAVSPSINEHDVVATQTSTVNEETSMHSSQTLGPYLLTPL